MKSLTVTFLGIMALAVAFAASTCMLGGCAVPGTGGAWTFQAPPAADVAQALTRAGQLASPPTSAASTTPPGEVSTPAAAVASTPAAVAVAKPDAFQIVQGAANTAAAFLPGPYGLIAGGVGLLAGLLRSMFVKRAATDAIRSVQPLIDQASPAQRDNIASIQSPAASALVDQAQGKGLAVPF